jgi:hypothetical protein
MENIDVTKTVYFYDDRSKYDSMMKLTDVLYVDDDTCVCITHWTAPELQQHSTKLMFGIKDGYVINGDYDSWIATNDTVWAEAEDKRIQLREKEC